MVTLNTNIDIQSLPAKVMELQEAVGPASATELSSAISVTVPAITDPDIAKVDVDVSEVFVLAPAVGDAVIAIPQEAMETNARIQNAYVIDANSIRVVFGSEGGNVTGGAKSFKFLLIDLT
jgi:phytoene dehydrogenase-like protein